MIPLRVKLSGFMSYRDEATLDFDGATLWMLQGANGAGKSSVFDAMTYALYGEHRGGKQGAESLIHHASSKLSVEFEFALGEDSYRIKRTLTRGGAGKGAKASFEVAHISGPHPPLPGKPSPQPVADASSASGVKRWVEENIGLTKETFCASVLLQQGRSDALLEASPAERHQMLSQIVDLSAYARLHDQADQKAKACKAEMEHLARRMQSLAPVDESEIARFQAEEAAAQADEGKAQAQLQSLAGLRVHAQRWQVLTTEQGQLQAALQTTDDLLRHRADIERDATRYTALDTMLPMLEGLSSDTTRLESVQHETTHAQQLAAEHHEEAEKLRQEHAVAQDRVNLLQTQHDAVTRQIHVANEWLVEHHADLHNLQQMATWREQLDALDKKLSLYPFDLDVQIQCAQRESETITALKVTLPQLREWKAAREEHEIAQREVALGIRQRDEVTPLLQGALARLLHAQASHEAKREEVGSVRLEVARLQTLLDGVVESVQRFRNIENDANCRHCGQPLTPQHRATETARLHHEYIQAQVNLERAQEGHVKAKEACATAQQEVKVAQHDLEMHKSAQSDAAQLIKGAELRVQHAIERAARTFEHLAEPYRVRLASQMSDSPLLVPLHFTPELLVGAYPSVEELKVLQDYIAQEARIKEQGKALREQIAKREAILTQRQTQGEQLSALEAQYDSGRERTLGEDAIGIKREKEEAGRQRDACMKPLSQAKSTCQALAARHAAREVEVAQSEVRMSHCVAQHKEATRDLERGYANLLPEQYAEVKRVVEQSGAVEGRYPASVMLTGALETWRNELSALQDAPPRVEALRQAMHHGETSRERLAQVEQQRSNLPLEAHRAVLEIEAELETAQRERAAFAQAREVARTEKHRLQERHAERMHVEEQERSAIHQEKLSRRLAQLLGRDELQRYLLQEAESSIVANANNVLDRLSRGNLRLELANSVEGSEGNSDTLSAANKALDLLARNAEVTAENESAAALPVAFLSGSQKFRVAVALALGIGQYASAGSRRIEAVIIDEGFGSLDKNGRSEMIEELHALGDDLSRVIVVSHQDEFAETFSHRYCVELRGGSSCVSLHGRE